MLKDTPLDMANLSDKLYLFEIELHAIQLLCGFRLSSVEKWRKIIKFVKDTSDQGLLQSEWFADFLQEEKKAAEILHRVEEVRESERDLNRSVSG